MRMDTALRRARLQIAPRAARQLTAFILTAKIGVEAASAGGVRPSRTGPGGVLSTVQV